MEDARRSIRYPAATFHPHIIVAAALALLDRREEAKIALDKLLEINHDFSLGAALPAGSPLNPAVIPPHFKKLLDGLRKAGLDVPDGPPAIEVNKPLS